MTLETMLVKCPHCETIKTVIKTDKSVQVRCVKDEGGCGERFYTKKNVFVLKKPSIKTDNETNKTQKIPAIKMNGMGQSLIIALNYAVNTIKNKPGVKAKKEDSTWYAHYKSWTSIREYFIKLEDEKG